MTHPGATTEVPVGEDIRKWKSGGKRDTDVGKLDFEGFLSPLVLKRFAIYMNKNRRMRDGSLRDSDNWQKGFGNFEEHSITCMKSLTRHFMDVWGIHRGDESIDVDLDEALCGIVFNAMAWLFKILESRQDFSIDVSIKDIKKIQEEKNNGKTRSNVNGW